ncbi:helix-turn-helix domain-containing protein [Indibacter alkaliphilus]|uniref:helix-turn-helix domain-containing protein n=1 Tax=Indibacter alkaliphilus TaxID=579922 RepID=UPI0002822BB3|nr:helix-turn-helix transcriptional regulator [Indibacter alkaliphilus]
MSVGLLLIIILLSLGTVNSIFLIVNKGKGHYPNTMLGWSLLMYNLFILTYFLWIEAEYILDMPHLLRSYSPFMYLCAPFFYFYVRNSAKGLRGLQTLDWIHFIPALIHFLELIPFYLLPTEVKLEMAQAIIASPDQINYLGSGLIPISFHYSFRIFLQTLYYIYCIHLVLQIKPDFFQRFNMDTLKDWLSIAIFLMGWIVFSNLLYVLLGYFNFGGNTFFLGQITIHISLIGILVLNIYVNFKPEIVYQFDPQKDFGSKQNEEGQTISLGQQDVTKHHAEVEKNEQLVAKTENKTIEALKYLLENEKIFQEKSLNLRDMSDRIGSSPKTLSTCIKLAYGKGFNEIVNEMRITYAIDKIENGYLDDFTLEALGEEVGFNSRTTFFNAFKKYEGCSPSEYWKKFQNGA